MSFDFKRALQKEINVGLKEQKIRYGVGAAAAVASVFLGNIPLLLLGAILLYTGKSRWCPVYSGLSKSTVDPNEPEPTCCGGHHGHSH
ncbi:YgaP-like transmembrane domain [Methylococcus sp. EFPC2]|uniref:YgaP-like transmembrane domain n=1 Tax=Methylococcus sp. EFPC2 TaxID=2812648 RepID=UPI00196807E9|nr:YgaP-like transmembrane domain [Methylococcus sp. EFPC2]QSA96891.1 DUF2892 domain-containing protein [Methylococcus sp. EFPC2]